MSEDEPQEAQNPAEKADQATTLSVEFSIPSQDDPCLVQLDAGTTTTFCGANGSGKTRLAVHIETELGLDAHRISAHRALSLNPHIHKISEREALAGLRTGTTGGNQRDQKRYRSGNRWGQREAVVLLDDFDYLIQALFADQMRVALRGHKRFHEGDCGPAEHTKFEKLSEIWSRLLLHRELVVDGDDINVRIPGAEATYTASEMSDGERAVFYLIGQTLAASNDSVLIIDEPELHLHPSIMTALWDELASARQDCAFVFITHNLEFASSQPGAKFVIREFDPAPTWTLEAIPEHTGFNEEFATLILGSRHPVLFVEGASSSLDRIIFRCAYPDHLVLPLGSCGAVIHAVSTMRNNPALTRVTCHGIVDRDHRSPDEVQHLCGLGVEVLPVAEIENIVLLPEVSRAIAAHEGREGADLDACLCRLRKAVFDLAESCGEKAAAVVRHTTRRINNFLRRVDLRDAESVQDLEQRCKLETESLDVGALASEAAEQIQSAIDNCDLGALLAHYDNKGLFALSAKHLKNTTVKPFKEWLERVLGNGSVPQLNEAIREALPKIPKDMVQPVKGDDPQLGANQNQPLAMVEHIPFWVSSSDGIGKTETVGLRLLDLFRAVPTDEVRLEMMDHWINFLYWYDLYPKDDIDDLHDLRTPDELVWATVSLANSRIDDLMAMFPELDGHPEPQQLVRKLIPDLETFLDLA